jgi:hypothetical protein
VRKSSVAAALERIAAALEEANKLSDFDKEMQALQLEAARMQVALWRDELNMEPTKRRHIHKNEVFGRAYK